MNTQLMARLQLENDLRPNDKNFELQLPANRIAQKSNKITDLRRLWHRPEVWSCCCGRVHPLIAERNWLDCP